MTQAPKDKAAKNPGSSREDRLKAALKANIARRKTQARERAAEEGNGAVQEQDKEA